MHASFGTALAHGNFPGVNLAHARVSLALVAAKALRLGELAIAVGALEVKLTL